MPGRGIGISKFLRQTFTSIVSVVWRWGDNAGTEKWGDNGGTEKWGDNL
jgi:hypothetical protein